jgi:hypothetical protein
MGLAGNGLAQSLSGGAGGGNNGTDGGPSTTSSPSSPSNSGSTPSIASQGGGGGGAGVLGGTGGSGTPSLGGSGGAGGASAGASGTAGRVGTLGTAGGGGGGGGAAGVAINSSVTNSSSISGGAGGAGANYFGSSAGGGGGGAGGYGAIVTNGTLTNSGTISGGVGGVGGNSAIGYENASGGDGGIGVYLGGLPTLVNSGNINGGVGGARGVGGGSGGSIGAGAPGVYVASGSTSTITNTGTITGGSGSYGIQNAGTISALNNAQAGLTYTGILPTNYNIIINSASSFGTLSATSVTGSTTFGITSSSLAAGTYSSVLSGLILGNIASGLTGTSGSYNYSLGLRSGSISVWDLIVSAINNGGSNTGDSGSSSTTSTPRYSNLIIKSGAITSTNNNAVVNGTTVTIASNSVVGGAAAVTNTGSTPGITNNGIVSGTSYGVVNAADSTIGTLTNNGIISGGVAGIANLSPNTIKLLVNTGTIFGGIDNTQGRIITLQNAQGGTVPLALSGNLPNNYQVIVNGLSSYGQLAVTKAAGQMTFGIATGSVVYTGLTYTSVLTGVGANNLLNTAGSSGGYLFKLTPETSGTVWNMTIGASVADTQSSLQSTTSALQNQYAAQSNGVIAGLTYDCNLFGENGICISAGGRQTGSSSFINGTTSALLIGAYKVNEKVRVGAYLDQNLSASNPNGIISNSNSTPMGGLFAVWNEQDDGLGTEVKASLGYNNKGMSITRPVVGTSEPGSGSTALTSQGANLVAKYNFGLDNRTTVSPYVGARYLSTVMNGYSEGQASNVLVPLAYSSLSMNATTALAGVGANHRLDEEITLSASAGMEADVQTTNGSYTVTNVNGLSPVALNPNPNKVRPTATVAAYYKLDKDAQIGLSVLYRQDSMTGMSSTTGMVTYTMGM